MTPINFPEVNCKFTAPPDLEESQCMTIAAYRGWIQGGSVDGSPVVVVAWQPSDTEREMIAEGKPVFISMIGGLAPHFLAMSFEEAIRPA